MSTVTETRHQPGGFQVDIQPDAPPSLLRQLSLDQIGYGLLVVTQQRVDPRDFSPPADPETTPHPLLSTARYAGVIRRTRNRYRTLEGDGLLILLGTQDEGSGSGYGQWSTALVDRRVGASMGIWAGLLINGGTTTATDNSSVTFPASHLRLGGFQSTSLVVARMGSLRTYRALLNEACWQTGHFYRVDPDGRIYIGSRAYAYGDTPRVVIGAGLPADDDPRWTTIRATLDDWGESTDTYINGAHADPPGQGDVSAWTNATGSVDFYVPTKNYPHNPRLHVSAEEEEIVTEWGNRTTWIVTDRNRILYTANFSGSIHPDHRLIPGEPMYLWDPEIGLTDPATTVTYSGQAIQPQTVELASYTWPIHEGMGVYILLRAGSGAIHRLIDLSDHVAYSYDPTVSLELGTTTTPL